MVSEAQKAAQKKYDKANFAYQTVKVKKELLEQFRQACADHGDKVNTVLRQAMEEYINRE